MRPTLVLSPRSDLPSSGVSRSTSSFFRLLMALTISAATFDIFLGGAGASAALIVSIRGMYTPNGAVRNSMIPREGNLGT